MEKRIFKIRQETPHINFRYKENDLALRATEFKPKLDRYLKKHFETAKINFDNFLIPGQKQAMDYKLKLSYEGPNSLFYLHPVHLNRNKERNLTEYINETIGRDCEVLHPTPFFANAPHISFVRSQDDIDPVESDLDKCEFANFYTHPIELRVISKHQELLKTIEEQIPYFLAITSFGKRTTKGFGSYKLDGNLLQLNNFGSFLENQGINGLYCKNKPSTNHQHYFETIDKDWKLLKSGLSYPNYQKSLLLHYFFDARAEIKWEKRGIKANLKGKKLELYNRLKSTHQSSSTFAGNERYEFIRALLGLAEHNEYSLVKPSERITVTINDVTEEKAVQRFQSPVTFKKINGNDCILIKPIPTELIYTENGERRKFNFKIGSTPLMSIPVPESFDITSFFDSSPVGLPYGKTVMTHLNYNKVS